MELKLNFEDVSFFYDRTQKHISLVRENAYKLTKFYTTDLFGLIQSVDHHDESKFRFPEFLPYVLITKIYREKINISEEDKIIIRKATYDHVLSNKHHPEYFCNDRNIDIINVFDRDKPSKNLIIKNMGIINIAEMVCDWEAMSIEKKSKTKDWADSNIGTRWTFEENEKDYIYEFIKFFENN